MGDGGGGRRESFSPSALSFFRFHLSPFPPETPDTQATHTKTLRQRQTKTHTWRLRTSVVPGLPFMLITAIRGMNLLHFTNKPQAAA